MKALAKDPTTGKFLKRKKPTPATSPATPGKSHSEEKPKPKPKPVIRHETLWEWLTGAHA